MDRITLKGLRFHGYHGVSESERQVGQKYEIDAELTCDLTAAGVTDELDHTIDYGQVANLIVEIGTKRSFQLIEALPPIQLRRRFWINFPFMKSGLA